MIIGAIMSYQNNPIEAIEADLNAVDQELDRVIEVRSAVLTLLGINEPCGQSHLEDVKKATHVVAGADYDELLSGCDVSNMTLADIAMELDAREQAIREERDSFDRARDELLLYNRAQTMKWLKRRIVDAKKKVKRAEMDHHIEQWTASEREVEAFEACLEQLTNVKAKYVD